jgi:hypothetical protein
VEINKIIMKIIYLTLFLINVFHAQTSSEVILSDTGQKTVEEVENELQCVFQTKWGEFFATNFPDLSIQYVRDQLSKGASPNKKYYISVNSTHNIMYFKEGQNYFLHLNQISENGDEVLLMRAFVKDDFADCIKILPDSCKWKGQREVKYIQVCEKGLVLAEGFTEDFFKVMIDEEEGDFDPIQIAQAIRECYQPKCYSIGYECYTKGLYFNPKKAKTYLDGVRDKMQEHGYDVYVDYDTMNIKYTKTLVTVNGEEVETGIDLKSLAFP